MRRAICILAAVPVLALAACGGGSADEPDAASAATATATATATPAKTAAAREQGATTKVAIQGFAFGPRTVKVKVGDTIAWTNEDAAAHTVTATSGGELDSGTLAQGADFEFTAAKAGTIQYFCSIHPSMTGTIEVQ